MIRRYLVHAAACVASVLLFGCGGDEGGTAERDTGHFTAKWTISNQRAPNYCVAYDATGALIDIRNDKEEFVAQIRVPCDQFESSIELPVDNYHASIVLVKENGDAVGNKIDLGTFKVGAGADITREATFAMPPPES
ncbi:hypothetical protein [Polyangium jinanense]|uniref:Lipoprotein n=1 Tax=Polyangium jinanense TaxID=2829994 RepID=A0A9X3X9W4_9BACT|nr:hypothetical protein [Polyangium jinanense]MDC3958789.1 hypothetical protein [Polyangium jinanense]MDC3985230.1 hypothetical protein [Polyangium jinanense]